MQEVYLNFLFLNGGFFGSGSSQEFANFTLAHFLPIILTIIVIILIKKYANKISKLDDVNFRVYFSIFNILLGVSFYFRLIFAGPSSPYADNTFIGDLPFQVCEITLLIASIAFINKSDKLFNVSFFLTMVCSIPALIIPETCLKYCGPTRFRYYQFFLMHLFPIIEVYYLMFVHKLKVKYTGIFYTAIILFINFVLCYKLNEIISLHGYEPTYMYMNLILGLNLPTIINKFISLFIIYFIFFMSLAHVVYLIYKKVSQ